jgi:hypothetical protein
MPIKTIHPAVDRVLPPLEGAPNTVNRNNCPTDFRTQVRCEKCKHICLLLRLSEFNAVYRAQSMDGLGELHDVHVELCLVDGRSYDCVYTYVVQLFLPVHNFECEYILPPGEMALHRMQFSRNLNATFFVAPTFGCESAACVVAKK